MKKVLKVGVVLLVVVLALALVTLRVIGLDPQELEGRNSKPPTTSRDPGFGFEGRLSPRPSRIGHS